MAFGWLSILGIAVGLALDAFAVAIVVGLTLETITPRHVFRLGFHFGLFQFLMPIVGWLAGEALAVYISSHTPWVAFALLTFVGGKMLWESFQSDKKAVDGDPTRGMMLVGLSLATSIDALAVGVSMALLGVSVWIPSVVIGIIAAALTTIGIVFGGRIGPRWGRWAEVVGGVVLLLIGLKVLLAG